MTWILIVFLVGTNGGNELQAVRFNTEAACEQAKTIIVDAAKEANVMGVPAFIGGDVLCIEDDK